MGRTLGWKGFLLDIQLPFIVFSLGSWIFFEPIKTFCLKEFGHFSQRFTLYKVKTNWQNKHGESFQVLNLIFCEILVLVFPELSNLTFNKFCSQLATSAFLDLINYACLDDVCCQFACNSSEASCKGCWDVRYTLDKCGNVLNNANDGACKTWIVLHELHKTLLSLDKHISQQPIWLQDLL